MFGGIGSTCYDLANALSRKGVSTTVFCGRAARNTTEKVNDNLSVVSLPCYDFPPRFLWFQLENFQFFSKLLKNYSVLHIVNPETGPLILRVAKTLKKPTLASIHGTYLASLGIQLGSPTHYWQLREIGSRFLGYPLHEYSQSSCLRNSDHVAVCSFSTVAELRTMYPRLAMDKISVIHNGINISEFNISPEELHDDVSIISYGRLIYAKGFTFLIKAVADLRKEIPNVRLQIFGNGPMKDVLMNMICELGLEANVQLNDFIPRKELIERIKRASIAVFPSLQEAQPIAFLEAMALRKPVVAFDYPVS